MKLFFFSFLLLLSSCITLGENKCHKGKWLTEPKHAEKTGLNPALDPRAQQKK